MCFICLVTTPSISSSIIILPRKISGQRFSNILVVYTWKMTWIIYIVLGSASHFSLPACPSYLSSFCLLIRMLYEGGRKKEKKVQGKEKTCETLLRVYFVYQNVAAVEAPSFPVCRMKVSPVFFCHKDYYQKLLVG